VDVAEREPELNGVVAGERENDALSTFVVTGECDPVCVADTTAVLVPVVIGVAAVVPDGSGLGDTERVTIAVAEEDDEAVCDADCDSVIACDNVCDVLGVLVAGCEPEGEMVAPVVPTGLLVPEPERVAIDEARGVETADCEPECDDVHVNDSVAAAVRVGVARGVSSAVATAVGDVVCVA
jgi:hypothetical protein